LIRSAGRVSYWFQATPGWLSTRTKQRDHPAKLARQATLRQLTHPKTLAPITIRHIFGKATGSREEKKGFEIFLSQTLLIFPLPVKKIQSPDQK
jgi:hypothetical protein